MMFKRVMGKASFATMQDMSGRIQLYVTDSDPGKEPHEAFKHYDIGDIIGAKACCSRPRPANSRCASSRCGCSPNRCGRCRRNFTASPIRSSATANAIWT